MSHENLTVCICSFHRTPLLCSRPRGQFGITRSVRLSVPWRSCRGYRHAGCLQLSRPPEVYGLRTHPRADVDPPRFLDRTAIGGGISSRRPWGDTVFELSDARAPPGFCNRGGEVRYGSVGGLEYKVPQSRLYCLCINVSLCSTALVYLSCDTKKFHDNESTHILHNFWTSTHRGEASPLPPWRRHCIYGSHGVWHSFTFTYDDDIQFPASSIVTTHTRAKIKGHLARKWEQKRNRRTDTTDRITFPPTRSIRFDAMLDK